MKCTVFAGTPTQAVGGFNEWAEDKALCRDIIIHSHVEPSKKDGEPDFVVILVFHPETPFWESTKAKPIQRVQPETTESARTVGEAAEP